MLEHLPGCISEKPAGNKIGYKTDMIPRVNIISKHSKHKSKWRRGRGHSEPLSRVQITWAPKRI